MRVLLQLLIALALVALATGCGHAVKPETSAPENTLERTVRKALLDDYQRWRGVPHKLGGASRSGIDCSAYAQRVYRDLFGINLPRTTAKQRRTGSSVASGPLRAGDLLFFNTGFRSRHVGIYLGDGSFIHVSSKLGVTRSSLENEYWRKHFQTARRVLRYR